MTATPYDEQTLLAGLARGEEAAFTEIYHLYHPRIYAYALQTVKLPELAEDLVQEVFVKIWELRGRMQIHSSLSAYLYRATRNKAIDLLHRIATDRQLRDEVIRRLEAALDDDLEAAARQEKYDRLLAASLAAMPAQRRRVYELCRQQGKSYEEAAAELGLSKNTVKEHMAKALRWLRKDLLDKGDLAVFLILLRQLF